MKGPGALGPTKPPRVRRLWSLVYPPFRSDVEDPYERVLSLRCQLRASLPEV